MLAGDAIFSNAPRTGGIATTTRDCRISGLPFSVSVSFGIQAIGRAYMPSYNSHYVLRCLESRSAAQHTTLLVRATTVY